MKDYKVLFGYAGILLSIGFVIRSITFAYAYPTGPNVSMGSNPQFSIITSNFLTEGNNTTEHDIFTISVDSDAVITGLSSIKTSVSYCSSANSNCMTSIKINNSPINNIFNSENMTWKPELVLHSGDTITISSKGYTSGYQSCQLQCRYYIQGYYAHP